MARTRAARVIQFAEIEGVRIAQVPLTHGLVALVDGEDAELVAGCMWFVDRAYPDLWYARTAAKGGTGSQFMHKRLTGWPQTDHINGDGLDNRRANLRRATHLQNARNRRTRRNSVSPYKGVSWHRPLGRWVPSIRVDGKGIHLGVHTKEEDAALAYDAAARAHFGEYAALNFPRPGERSALRLDADGAITAAPRGYARDYRPGRIPVEELDAAVVRYAEGVR